MKIHLKGYFFALIAVFFWSFSVVVAKIIADDIAPFQLAAVKWSVALAVLLPLTVREMGREWRLLLEKAGWLIGLAFSGVILFNVFMYKAAETASAVNMALIGALGPLFLVLFSKIFFHLPVTRIQMIGYLLTLCGVLIVITQNDFSMLVTLSFGMGDVWMLGSALAFGVFGMLQNRRPPRISPMVMTTACVAIGTVVLWPWSLVMTDYTQIQWRLHLVLLLLFAGIGPSAITYFAWNTALHELGHFKTALLYYVQPLLTLVWAYLFLNETLSVPQFYGAGIVIIGIVLAHLRRR